MGLFGKLFGGAEAMPQEEAGKDMEGGAGGGVTPEAPAETDNIQEQVEAVGEAATEAPEEKPAETAAPEAPVETPEAEKGSGQAE